MRRLRNRRLQRKISRIFILNDMYWERRNVYFFIIILIVILIAILNFILNVIFLIYFIYAVLLVLLSHKQRLFIWFSSPMGM